MADMTPEEQALFDSIAGKADDGPAELVNLHDHEVMECEAVLNALSARQGNSMDLEAFRIEARERFEEIGLVVDVKVFESGVQPGVWEWDIDIVGRTERLSHGFDHERQQWEVRNDILDLGTGGTIKVDGSIAEGGV
jgi:hypothetical protein